MSQSQPRLDDLRIERKPVPETPRRTGLAFAIGLTLAVAAVVWWWFGRPQAVPVTTALARENATPAGDRTVLNASGYVTARREATVSSKVMGKVVEILIEEGIAVKQGQLLAKLDDANAQAALQLARAQLAAVRAGLEETRVRLAEANLELRRQTQLKQDKVAALAEFDRAEAAAAALRARLAQQQSELTVAERNLAVYEQQAADTLIRAPFAGIVTSKNAQPGEMISPMASGGFTRTGICTIVDMESLEIEIDVNESYINRVAPGQAIEATLDAYPEWKIPCKVIAIIPTADRQKSTVRVRVGFDKLDPRILPQMAVKVAFRETTQATASSAPSRSVIVPRGAVTSRDGRDVVFVVQNGRVERRAVTVGSTVGTDTTLTAGLAARERIVVDPTAEITDGVRVEEKKR
ncbi:MAG: efflux RND transporter periplasmic adaptor subunit [Verrucomicrobia bacterium]|nr:efflux RND transporter periplasmic adaptor subunit [Verrucomicrobiota bacterium]